jgi:hypothetical protein
LTELEKARQIMLMLVDIDPSNAQWKRHLAWLEQQIARVHAMAARSPDGG